MTLPEYPAAIREALACFEALRRLQFSAADIYFQGDPVGDERNKLFVILRTQGKQWAYEAGPIEGEHKVFVEKLKAATARWNEGRQDEMAAVYRDSKIVCNGTGLILSLNAAGIAWTRTDA